MQRKKPPTKQDVKSSTLLGVTIREIICNLNSFGNLVRQKPFSNYVYDHDHPKGATVTLMQLKGQDSAIRHNL